MLPLLLPAAASAALLLLVQLALLLLLCRCCCCCCCFAAAVLYEEVGTAVSGYNPNYEGEAIMKCRAMRRRRQHWQEEEPRVVRELSAAVDAVLGEGSSASGGVPPSGIFGPDDPDI
jgi:hypothetical protein